MYLVVCDAQRRILDIVARWRGSVHDSRIWDSNHLKEEFEEGRMTGILLGDAGYPCRPYLLTPFLNPQTPCQERYTGIFQNTDYEFTIRFQRFFFKMVVDISTTVPQRVKALHNDMQISLITAKIAIIAMAILFNIRKQFDHFDYDSDDEKNNSENEEDNAAIPNRAAQSDTAFRLEFAQRHFS
ncbi:putative nuclease HARBI1 [Monomorium pharaonis]|uniref:putative nuclease HARBI1 n=1 Tax=Monomorium pharaonis TaxID=307658 RepID=UPI001747A671|nr:putative nuclease HARBI1 [Monomorium pharaonis]